jgi:hypothetical protein
MRIVVFDLDETLGYFSELGMFYDCISKITNNRPISQEEFNQILDMYPEFIRPNIINILNYLKKKKISKACSKIMIYTNNQGPKSWAEQIISYFETKIHYKLFDQIVCAFKVNGKQIEMNRTTHDKTHSDLIRCTQIPANTQICFLDDIYHPDMANDNIYYINLKPYIHDLPIDEIISRFTKSQIYTEVKHIEGVADKIKSEFKRFDYNYTHKKTEDMEIDVILGKDIMLHLKIFFNKTNTNKSARTKRSVKNKTKKKYN